jgi:hypothetical protein
VGGLGAGASGPPLQLLAHLDTAQDANQGHHRSPFRLPHHGQGELDAGATSGVGGDGRTERGSTRVRPYLFDSAATGTIARIPEDETGRRRLASCPGRLRGSAWLTEKTEFDLGKNVSIAVGLYSFADWRYQATLAQPPMRGLKFSANSSWGEQRKRYALRS